MKKDYVPVGVFKRKDGTAYITVGGLEIKWRKFESIVDAMTTALDYDEGNHNDGKAAQNCQVENFDLPKSKRPTLRT